MTGNKDDTIYSACCGVEMPDWPDSDFCPACGEHTGATDADDKEVHLPANRGETTKDQGCGEPVNNKDGGPIIIG